MEEETKPDLGAWTKPWVIIYFPTSTMKIDHENVGKYTSPMAVMGWSSKQSSHPTCIGLLKTPSSVDSEVIRQYTHQTRAIHFVEGTSHILDIQNRIRLEHSAHWAIKGYPGSVTVGTLNPGDNLPMQGYPFRHQLGAVVHTEWYHFGSWQGYLD